MKKAYIIFILLSSFLFFPRIIKSAIIYSNDFEMDDGGLVQIGSRNYIWECGIPKFTGPTNTHSGQRCWGTIIQGNYGNGTNKEYLVMTNVNLTTAIYAYLEFWHYYKISWDWMDAATVEISTNNGLTYTNLGNYPFDYPYDGIGILDGGPGYLGTEETNWNYASFDLTPYCGKKVYIRFRFESNDWDNNYPGWYIDDIVIKDTPIPMAGTGIVSNYPFKVFKNSTNTFYFFYTAEKSIYDGRVTLEIPAGWSQPQKTNPLQEGYVRVFPVLGISYSISNRTVIVDITNLQQGEILEIRYGGAFGAIAPSEAGVYTFIMKSGNNREGMLEIENSPWVAVQPKIVPPYTENFETDSGGWYATGDKKQWEYGIPANVGPATAHSGSYCWGTKIDDYYQLSATSEKLYLSPIDLTGITTNVYLSFWQWYDFYYHNSDSHDGVAIFISTNGGTNYFRLEARYGTEYNDYSWTSPFWSFNTNPPYCWSQKSDDWKQVFIDLTEFTSKMIYLYFEFRAYNWRYANYAGFYIDDIEVQKATPPVAGYGKCLIHPLATYPSSTGTYKITYISDRVIYNGEVTIDIPNDWTTPQNAIPGNPGYVYIISTNSNVKIKTTPDIAGNTITVTITNMLAGCDFTLVYSNATAQSSEGSAVFVTKSARAGEPLTEISHSPEVRVMPLVSTIPWSNNFEINSGNFIQLGDTNTFWEYGTPQNPGPSNAYSGSKCWGTLLSQDIVPDYKNYNLYTPFYNLAGISNAILDFWYYADLPGAGYYGAQVLITTNNGKSFEVLGKYPSDYDYEYFYWENGENQPGWASSTAGWEKKIIDLTPYVGKIIQLKFRFINQGWDLGYSGFYIDNVSIKKTYPPIAGTGTGEVSPNVTAPGTTGDYEFTYTAEQNFYDGKVTIKIPSDWTAPQNTAPGNPGYVKIISVLSNAKINNNLNISGTGPWTITIDVTNIPAGDGFILAYSNATAPNTVGVSTFIMKSALDSETLTELSQSPEIARLNTISIPFTHNFDSDNGGWVEAGSTHYLWEWGIPSWGPSSAHSGSRVWGTVLDDNYNEMGVLDKLTSPIIDLTTATQAHLAFYQWYRFGDGMSSGAAANVMISTNFKDFYVLGEYPKNYPSSWAFWWEGPKYGQPGYSAWDWDTQGKWEKRTFNLIDYVGKKIILRFDFGSPDDTWVRYDFPGWYIDDVSVQPTPPPIAGTGSASIWPETAIANTTNNYTLIYTAREDIADGTIEIVFPTGWSAPQTNNTTAEGYVYLETYDTFTYSLSISNGNRLMINVQGLDYSESFNIHYRNAVAPSTTGTYIFTNKSAGAGEQLTPLDYSPEVVVQEIKYLPYEEDFEADDGGWIADGNLKIFEWGTPANVGPDAAHSGKYCWATKIDGFYNTDNTWEYITSPPIDVTAETQVYLTFYQYFDTEADPLKNGGRGGGDGTILEIAYADTLEGLTTAGFEKVGSYPQTYNQKLDWFECWGGYSGGWVRQEINLSAFKGKYIKLRFTFQSDWDYSSLPGWYLDDIRITPTAPKPPAVPFEDSGKHIGNNNSAGVTLLDFDNDGDFDLIENNYEQTYNIIYKNDGNGSLSQYKSIGKNSTFVLRFADFNNDGFYDAFAGNCKGDIDAPSEQPNEIFINNQGEDFSLHQTVGNDITRDVALGDIDNDGDIDIFVANIGANSLLINDGKGNFSESETILPGNETTTAVFGDLNNDGYIDLVIGNRNGEANRVLLNNGKGTLVDSGQSLGKYDTTSIALGDIDNDGDIDIVFGTKTLIKIWTNTGQGKFGFTSDTRFQARNESYLTNITWDVKLADVDNDGDLDILAANENDTDMVWLNSGAGYFKDSGNYLGSYASKHLSVADFNKDGFLDFAVGNSYNQPNIIWLNKMTNSNINDKPSPPKSLSVEFEGNDAIIKWTPGSDAETPSNLLTYNLRIGTTPGGNDILSVPGNGYYCNGPGNVGKGKVVNGTHYWRIKNLTKISYYYFSIQTVDSGLRGSDWKTIQYYHDPKAPDVDEFKVSDNFLNLNNDENCIITYNLGKASKVSIEIINLEGTVVKTIIKDEQKPAGYNPYIHKEVWDGKNEAGKKIAPGLYWVVFKVSTWPEIKKKRVLIIW